jgi:O-antigen/teichoic acid export membrane protein
MTDLCRAEPASANTQPEFLPDSPLTQRPAALFAERASASSLLIDPQRMAGRLVRFFADLLPIRYLALRSCALSTALIASLVQTFVFARVLDPERFSLFILVGASGLAMWLFDLGLTKILFVRMRERYLNRDETRSVGAQAGAISLVYTVLVSAGALICAVTAARRPDVSFWGAAELGLFFFYTGINLVWSIFRNVSVAVDEYLFFETLEGLRRAAYVVLLFALLVGLTVGAFVVAINIVWLILFALLGSRLMRRDALVLDAPRVLAHLRTFLRDNGKDALRTGTHAAGEIYTYFALYLVVPFAFGLGAPTIIVDTALKIFIGITNICAAGCDLLVPRLTAAYAARDRRTLVHALLLAIILCALLALGVSAILLFNAQGFFALLLGTSTTMPAEVTPTLIVLIFFAALAQPGSILLQYTGFFRQISRLSIANTALITVALAIGVVAGVDIVSMLVIYAVASALRTPLYLYLAFAGPIRSARSG